MNDNELLKHDMGSGVEAFTTMRHAELPYPILLGRQVHGHKVGLVDDMHLSTADFDGYDALITNLPIAIGIRTADCIPILLYDPVQKAVAAIHAGWKGTVQKIVHHTISQLTATYGTHPQHLVAAIGPGIGFHSFQVGEEVAQIFKEAGFPTDAIWRWDGVPESMTMKGGHHIDLKAANKWLLMSAGVPEEQIYVSDIDTYTDTRFFSARREGQQCGRAISSVRLHKAYPKTSFFPQKATIIRHALDR